MTTSPVFKSTESRERIRVRYDQILNAFPFNQQYVETTYGRTFILEAGDPNNPPLILLHGSCSNSAFWFAEISALSPMFHVMAIDIIGEAGNSDDNRPDLHSDGYAEWLRQVFMELSVNSAVVVGNSLGGWVALRFAERYPECVADLVLIATAGLSGLNPEFLAKADETSRKNEPMTFEATVVGANGLPKEVEEFINLIISGYNPITEALPILTDEQLGKLHMPVLLIVGENDELIDTATAMQRLGRLVAGAEIHLLENTGHLVLNPLEFMIPFLNEHRTQLALTLI